jgi:hypothetical protein
VLELLSTLFDMLSQEVYGSMNIDGADERDQLEVELLCAEREQEWTVLEDLLHCWGDSSLNEVIWVFDALLQIGIKLVMMEEGSLELGEANLQIEVWESWLCKIGGVCLLVDDIVGFHDETDSFAADQVLVGKEEVERLQDLERLTKLFLCLVMSALFWLFGDRCGLLWLRWALDDFFSFHLFINFGKKSSFLVAILVLFSNLFEDFEFLLQNLGDKLMDGRAGNISDSFALGPGPLLGCAC